MYKTAAALALLHSIGEIRQKNVLQSLNDPLVSRNGFLNSIGSLFGFGSSNSNVCFSLLFHSKFKYLFFFKKYFIVFESSQQQRVKLSTQNPELAGLLKQLLDSTQPMLTPENTTWDMTSNFLN